MAALLRHLRRIHRLCGLQPFALPSIALLLVAVLFDQYAGDFFSRREDVDGLARQVERMRDKVAQQGRFEQIVSDGRPTYTRMSGRVFSASGPEQARADLQAQLQTFLQDLPAEDVSVVPAGQDAPGKSGMVAVEATFAGVPQQLVRLQRKLDEAPQTLRIAGIEVKRVSGEGSVAERIRVKIRVEAWFVRSEPNNGPGKRADTRDRR